MTERNMKSHIKQQAGILKKKLIEIENIFFNGAILFFLQLTIYHLSVSKYH